jgi:hypothetical protein
VQANSLQALICQAELAGGQSAQSPDARAIADASQGASSAEGLISSLMQAGAGNMHDTRIKQIQQQAERGGWSDNDRQMVSALRKDQSGKALDARSMSGLSMSRPGGGGGYEGGGRRMGGGGGDALTQLAEMLAKYKASSEYNNRPLGPGADANYGKLARSEAAAGMEMLGPLYAELMKQKKLETQMMNTQANEASKSRSGIRGTGMNVESGGRGDNSDSASFSQTESHNSRQYGGVRDEALKAALAYMKIKAPHLLGSL